MEAESSPTSRTYSEHNPVCLTDLVVLFILPLVMLCAAICYKEYNSTGEEVKTPARQEVVKRGK